jgi:protein involved in polysaccharide export with SLBB domain
VRYLDDRFNDLGLDKNAIEKENLELNITNVYREIQRLDQESQLLGLSVTPGQAGGAIPAVTQEATRLAMELGIQRQVYNQLTMQYELLKVTMDSDTPAFQILELAEAPDRKSGPSRGLICVIVTLAAAFFAVFLAFIQNGIKKIRQDPKAMAKLQTKHILLPALILCLAFPLSAQETSLADLGEHTPRLMFALSTPDYPATPGDVYNLSYDPIAATRETAVSIPLTLDAGYQLKILNMGTINARNKTYLQVRNEVEILVSRNFPNSGVTVTLARMGSFTILVTGETAAAGERNVDGLTRVSSQLTSLTAKASSRFVRVTSVSGEVRTYDLFIARRTGDPSQNPYIRPGDKIEILPADRVVSIGGEVFRPGTYELLPGEELERLVTYYGDGFTLGADPSRIRLSRISTDVAGETRIFDYTGNTGMTLEDRDTIAVSNKMIMRPVAFFEGALTRAMEAMELEQTDASIEGTAKLEYPFYEGETLGNAVRAISSQFSSSSDLANAYVIRGSEHIPMDLRRYLYYNDFSRDFALLNGDTIIIPFIQYFVLVAGAVKAPGRYPYVPDRLADYYINLAGGRDLVQNSGRGLTVTDMDSRAVDADGIIAPEMMITVPRNRWLITFNEVAPVVTTVLSLVTTVLTIFAAVGLFNR